MMWSSSCRWNGVFDVVHAPRLLTRGQDIPEDRVRYDVVCWRRSAILLIEITTQVDLTDFNMLSYSMLDGAGPESWDDRDPEIPPDLVGAIFGIFPHPDRSHKLVLRWPTACTELRNVRDPSASGQTP